MFAKPKILVIQEPASDGESLRGLLDSAHYQAIITENADDGLAYVESPIDMVLSGVSLDDPRGRELLDRWKTQRPEVPFVLLRRGLDHEAILRGKEQGATGMISLSADNSEIRAQMDKWLINYRSNQTDHNQGRLPLRSEPQRADFAAIRIPPGTTLEQLERAAVEQSLEQHQGNRTHAAKELGISVRTLQRKLKAWGESREGRSDGAPQKREPMLRNDQPREWNGNPAAPRQSPARSRLATV